MFGFFSKKKETSQPAVVPHHDVHPSGPSAAAHPSGPGTPGISYSPTLVSELKHDHQILLGIFGEITTAHRSGDLRQTSALLEKFQSALAGHLLKENVRFYIYLERSLAADAGSQTLVRQFRHEMDGIGKAVLAFLARYRNIATDPTLAGSFGADLADVGKVLVERIRNEEETLYSLYLPHY